MSKIVVDLENKESEANAPNFGEYQTPKKRGKFVKILGIIAGIVGILGLIVVIGGFFYWQHLKTTPQYSLALLVDAAHNDDQEKVDEIVDVDAVVEDFVPQIIDKAIELYGRGVAPDVVERAMTLARPILPVVKQRAKAELPQLIREKTKKFADIPFWAIAVGANQYLDIKKDGDKAVIKSKMADRPLEVEMKRDGNRWKIVALKDEQLAQNIAGKIGQEILGMAKNRSRDQIENMGKDLGIENMQDLMEKAEDIFK